MKFLAIMKDSFREAVDAKVFYVMIVLSIMLIIGTLSLGFKPSQNSANDFMKDRVAITAGIDLNDLNMNQVKDAMFRGQDMNDGDAQKIFKRLENAGKARVLTVEQLDAKEQNSPDSRYKLIIGVEYFNPERAALFRRNPAEAERLMKEQFGRLGDIRLVETNKVKYLPPGSPELGKDLQEKDFVAESDFPFAETSVTGRGHPDPRNEVFYEIETGPSEHTRVLWNHELSVVFGWQTLGSAPLGDWMFILESKIVNGVGAWVSLIISVVITSFFIPNMLRKGTIDLLIVKPINRWSLLLMKYVGGLTFIFLNTTLAIGGTWIALGIKTGVWTPGFLISIPMVTFFFAILYAVSTLLAVITRSAIACIILTCIVWFILWVVGVLYQVTDMFVQMETAKAAAENRPVGEENTFVKTIKVIHRILPRTSDLDTLVDLQLRKELQPDQAEIIKKLDLQAKQISWGESITVSVIFVVLILSLSCWLFSIKDY